MFYVHNRDGVGMFKSESFASAKAYALGLKARFEEENFDIIEIKQVWTTQTFDELMEFVKDDGGRAAAGFLGIAGDCVTRAICIATGLPYTIVYDRLSEGNATQRMSKKSRGHRASGIRTAAHGIWTKRKWFKDYMKELGFVWVPTMKIGAGCKVHLDAKELPKGRLVVSLSKHYTTMIDGVIHDTYDPRRSASYSFEPDRGQALKANQGRNENGVWTEVGGRCVYGYWRYMR